MKDNNFNSNEMYNRARTNSVGEQKQVRYVKMKKDVHFSRLKAMFIVGSIVAIIATSGIFYTVDKITDMYQTSTIVKENIQYGKKLVNENTKRTSDNQNFYYETYDIAHELVKDPANFDGNLYGVYTSIGYNKASQLKQMEDVVSYVGSIVSSSKEDLGINYYKDFTDYCIKKGFVKEDGTIDLSAYEKAVRSQLVKEQQINKLQEEVTNFKTR